MKSTSRPPNIQIFKLLTISPRNLKTLNSRTLLGTHTTYGKSKNFSSSVAEFLLKFRWPPLGVPPLYVSKLIPKMSRTQVSPTECLSPRTPAQERQSPQETVDIFSRRRYTSPYLSLQQLGGSHEPNCQEMGRPKEKKGA